MERIIKRFLNSRNIWNDEVLKKRLQHYYFLLNHNIPQNSYYLICKYIPADFTGDENIKELWELHNSLKNEFEKNLHDYSIMDLNLKNLPNRCFLDLKIHLAITLLENCGLCENNCRVNRNDQVGRCGLKKESHYSSAFLHHGEEAPLIPSGTIFFTGCNFSCVFCQNEDISRAGKEISLEKNGIITNPKKLADISEELIQRGAININWVGGDPIPNLHNILQSFKYQTSNICHLWNSNFYNSIQSLEILTDVMDLWLLDFKYGNNDCGKKYSGVNGYWDILKRNFLYIKEHGSKNIIIRHLVIPGHIDCCSQPILAWLAENMREFVVVNIMGQYHPEYKVNSKNYSEINRRVSADELNEVHEYAKKIKIKIL